MTELLPIHRLKELFSAIHGLRVGVVGDFTLDGYWTADMTRASLSRETPLYPRPVVSERYSCGGAANVAWNVAELKPASVRAFTVLGDDWRGALLRGLLQDAGVGLDDALTMPGLMTPFFGKVLLAAGETHQEDARLDFINTATLPVEVEQDLLDRLAAALPDLDALVIADYQALGVVTPRVRDGLNAFAAQAADTVIAVDSRERVGLFYDMVRKPNRVEAARWLFPGRAPDLIGLDEFAEAALHPQVACGCPLVITFGASGSLVIEGGESHLVPALRLPGPLDTVGAGDTFLSALTASLAAGANAVEAAYFGHLAASVTVRKLGITGTASEEEILAAAQASRETGEVDE